MIAAAVCLRVPFLADACLFQPVAEPERELGDSLANFLRDLEVSGLGNCAESHEPHANGEA